MLAAAGACVAFDRLFGLSSSWMRDVVAALALERLVLAFQQEWALLEVQALEEPELSEKRIALLGGLRSAASLVIETETLEWVSEFQARVSADVNLGLSSAPDAARGVVQSRES